MIQAGLFTGTNLYRNSPEDNLRGCVPDSVQMREWGQLTQGLTMDECAVLWDVETAKKDLTWGLDILVSNFNYLQRVFWSHSSHGTQVPGDEVDKFCGAICCHDIKEDRAGWESATVLSENELRQIFAPLPLTCLLEIFLDCCFAGEFLRELGRRHAAARYLPNPGLHEMVRPRHPFARLMEDRKGQDIVIWAACQENQTSADAFLGGGWHGAFTWFFCKEYQPDMPRRVLLANIIKALREAGYSQTPVLGCSEALRNLPVGVF